MHWVFDIGLCIGLGYMHWRMIGLNEIHIKSLNNLLDAVATQDETIREIVGGLGAGEVRH